jgi:hypothetical protein
MPRVTIFGPFNGKSAARGTANDVARQSRALDVGRPAADGTEGRYASPSVHWPGSSVRFLAFALADQAGVGIGGRGMRVIAALLAMEVTAIALVVVLRSEALRFRRTSSR